MYKHQSGGGWLKILWARWENNEIPRNILGDIAGSFHACQELWGCSARVYGPVVEHLLSSHEALALIPSSSSKAKQLEGAVKSLSHRLNNSLI